MPRALPFWLNVLGLIVQLSGAALGTYALKVTPEQAVELGASRFSGDNLQENLKLPLVQSFLNQYRLARWAFVLVAMGTGLQLAAVVIQQRQAN